MRIKVIKPKKAEKKLLRVAAYVRVSTDSEEQEGSLINQSRYFQDLIMNNPDYEFAGVYSDRGITGYKEERPEFQRMVQDALAGKIDLIYVKSISRFGRNTEVVLRTLRELKAHGVGVFFELQNINTLTAAGELLLTLFAAFAQGESDNYSELAKMRFANQCKKGIVPTRTKKAFGFEPDDNGGLRIVPQEAETVKRIFALALQGYKPSNIRYWLNGKGIPAPKGGQWDDTAVNRILRNVLYKGNVRLRKSYLDSSRKRRPNNGMADSWYITANHDAIIDPKDWDRVQELLAVKPEPQTEPVAYAEKGPDGQFLLRGMLYCPYCGNILHHKWCNGKRQEFWACATNLKQTKSACKGIYVPAQEAAKWDITEPTSVLESVDEFGLHHFEPVPKRNYERRVGCPYK